MGAWLFGMTSLLIMKTKSSKVTPNWRLETGPLLCLVALVTRPHTHSHRDTHTNTHSHDGRRSIFIVIRYTNCTRLQEPNVTTLQLVCKGRLHTHILSNYLQQRLPPIYFVDRAASRSTQFSIGSLTLENISVSPSLLPTTSP